MGTRKYMVSVIGGHKCSEEDARLAYDVGRIIAEEGAVLVSGGLSGIMASASKGAKSAGGLTVGIIPGTDKGAANDDVDIVIPTDMGYSRNTLVAGAGDMVVAFRGEYGTLSEISFAFIGGKKVYGFNSWDIEGVVPLERPEDLRDILKGEMR